MRKKSHVSLARHIISECETGYAITHEGSFKLGSLVPDLVPTFLTKKHDIECTFDIMEKKIYKIVDNFDVSKGLTKRSTKDLGVVSHYIADYFTFPHNVVYAGTLKDHMRYEKQLKEALKLYVRSIDVDTPAEGICPIKDITDIIDYIKICHKDYIDHLKGTIYSDCTHIVAICQAVIKAILGLLEIKRQQVICLA